MGQWTDALTSSGRHAVRHGIIKGYPSRFKLGSPRIASEEGLQSGQKQPLGCTAFRHLKRPHLAGWRLRQTLFLAITGVGARRGVNSQGALNAFGRSSPLCGTQHKAELFEQTIQQVPTFSGRPNGALAQRLISHQPPACRSPSRNPPIQATGARQFCVCSAIRHSEQTHIPSGSRTWRSPCSHPRQRRPQSSARS
jgi:hypothetical protein